MNSSSSDRDAGRGGAPGGSGTVGAPGEGAPAGGRGGRGGRDSRAARSDGDPAGGVDAVRAGAAVGIPEGARRAGRIPGAAGGDDLADLALHTITTKPWPVATAIERWARAGVRGITWWDDSFDGADEAALAALGRRAADAGLESVAVARGGFFVDPDPEREGAALARSASLVRAAALLGAPMLVIVAGSHPKVPLPEARERVGAALAKLAVVAQREGVRLALEPLHPMYTADRSAVNTLAQANGICAAVGSPALGVAVDVYHVWWDPELEAGIRAAGREGRLFAFHVCDWRVPTEDMLWDRGIMGEGCIDIPSIRAVMEDSGFRGWREVEIFSKRHWARDQDEYLADIIEGYRRYV